MEITKILPQSTRLLTGTLCFILSCILGTVATAQSAYYWSNNTKIEMKENRSSIIFQFKENVAIQSYFEKSVNTIASVEIHEVQNRAIVHFHRNQSNTPQDIAKTLGINTSDLKSAAFGLMLEDGFKIWATHDIVLSLRKDANISDFTAILDKHKAIVKDTKHNRITLELSDVTKVVSLANQLYENPKVIWAHPDFYAKVQHNYIPTDPLYSNQFQMNNSNDVDCDAPEAWDLTKGVAGLRVAVIDDGLELHEDLPTLNTSLGYTPVNNGNGTPVSSGKHGVACAGSISAAHNGIGVAGIAPNVEIFSVNIFYGGETGSDLANAITYAKNKGADVLSNSWGYGSCSYNVDVLNTALADAKNNGRGGKGCVIVFAAGNEYLSCVSYPGNNPNVIGVGAITNTGRRSDYSNKGNKLDISAPSSGGTMGVYTTDRMGGAGYSSGNYTGTFGGTSSACPLVSGVAALVLSTNSNLTSSEVQNILETTADDMGSNGFDVEFGHGRVNAHQAVLAANGGGGGTPTPSCVQSSVDFTLNTDRYASETSWVLTNSSGTIIHSGNSYNNNQSYTFNWNLAVGNYTFTINDAAGDGICCNYGNGSYSLVGGTTSIKSGGSFTSSESTNFCVESSTSSCVGSSVGFTLNTDRYASETSWALTNSSGTTVHSGNSYNNNQSYTLNWNLADDTYTFTINDAAADGICCSYGNGSYSLVGGTTSIKSGGSFASSESTTFCVEGARSRFNSNGSASPTVFADEATIHGVEGDVSSTLTIYPNPTKDQLVLELNQLKEGTQASIIDATGRLVWSNTLTTTKSSIDVQKFTAGIYNLTIREPNGTLITKHFVKL